MTVEAQPAIGNDVMARPAFAGLRLWRTLCNRAISPLFAILLLGYWEFHVRYFEVEALLLPPPSHIAVSFWNGMASGLFLKHFGITVYRALSGFAMLTPCGFAPFGSIESALAKISAASIPSGTNAFSMHMLFVLLGFLRIGALAQDSISNGGTGTSLVDNGVSPSFTLNALNVGSGGLSLGLSGADITLDNTLAGTNLAGGDAAVYVGKAASIKKRVASHFSTRAAKAAISPHLTSRRL